MTRALVQPRFYALELSSVTSVALREIDPPTENNDTGQSSPKARGGFFSRILGRRPSSPPVALTTHDLSRIDERGRLLAELDQFCAAATDEVQALAPATDELGLYVTCKNDVGQWTVRFGRLSEDNASFLVAYEVVRTKTSRSVEQLVPVRRDSHTTRDIALAVTRAMSSLTISRDADSYNYLGLVEPSGAITIYFYPASMSHEYDHQGADSVIEIRDDGQPVVSRVHDMLYTIPRADSREDIALWVHQHLLDRPLSPLDVFYVYRNPGSVRTMVVCADMNTVESGSSTSLRITHGGWGYFLERNKPINAVRLDDGQTIPTKPFLDALKELNR